jgi:dolichol-phosphate mannosyltransferase
MRHLLGSKLIKFLLGGGLSAGVNLALIFLLIEQLGFNSPVLRNAANLIAIEISLVFSFFVYRLFVWPGGSWRFRAVFLKQLPLYHISAGSAVLARVLLVFPLLDFFQVPYFLNTLVGVLLSASINYFLSDRFVFRQPTDRPDQDSTYYPEALNPSLSSEASLSQECLPSRGRLPLKTFSVTIPAYNEAEGIASTVASMSQALEQAGINYEILVINDNSKDRTEQVLQQLCAENSNVRYINNYYPNGFGFAVRCGLENFRGDAVAIVMADSSDDPADLVSYFRCLQAGYDCAFGSRFVKGGKVVDYPQHKLVINRLANLFIQIIFGLSFNDTTNAFKAYRKEVIVGINPLISHHFNLTVELPLKSIVRGYSYQVLPITWRNRTTGISKLKLKEMGSRYLFIVLYIWLEKHLSRGDYHLSTSKKHQQPLKSKAKSHV